MPSNMHAGLTGALRATPLTPQQVFDNALLGVRGQNYRAARKPSGGCVYRANDGKKCGIGHSIPDRLYQKSMDGGMTPCGGFVDDTGIARVMGAFPSLEALFKNCPPSLLEELQAAHDALSPNAYVKEAQTFENSMKEIAGIYGLVYKAP